MLFTSASLALFTTLAATPPIDTTPQSATPQSAPSQLDSPARRFASRRPAQRLGPSKRRSARMMLGLGAGFFTGFYLGTTAIAAGQLDEIHADGTNSGAEHRTHLNSRLLFVPVLGPSAAPPFAKSKGDTVAFVGMGLIQGVMVSMMTVSAVLLTRDARARRWDLGGIADRSGAQVSFRLRF